MIFAWGLLLVLPGAARAFHDGGVGSCQACHIMHTSEDGMSEDPTGQPLLLRYVDSSDLCLSCHAEALGAVLWPDPLAPPPELGAGNFTFLYEDDLNDSSHGIQYPIPGHRAGHSIVAPAWGLTADPDFPIAPGGNFPSRDLACTSCHDPHGNTNFRMLWGAGPVGDGGYVFQYPAPGGAGLPLDGGPESPIAHSAYLGGWSDWCGNCHGLYHDEFEGQGWDHPVDETLDGDTVAAYNGYDGPDNVSGGDAGTAYLPEVAIEDPGAAVESSAGATSQSRISCLTCHRAHASSGPASTRWDPNVRFLADDGQASGSHPLPDPYGHPQQRPLCVKCHYEEAQGHGFGRACMDCHRGRDD